MCDFTVADYGVVENILKVISRELSVVEVMRVFKGEIGPAERLQPSLFNYIRERLLNGEEPTLARRQQAVEALLANCKSSLVAIEVSQCAPWYASRTLDPKTAQFVHIEIGTLFFWNFQCSTAIREYIEGIVGII